MPLQLSTPSLLAVATGITGSAWASGAIASVSLISIPAARIAPEATARIWAELFVRAVAIMPKFAITTALAYLYAAYDVRQQRGRWTGFVAGAVLTVSIVPYTLALMVPTNSLLQAAADGVSQPSQGEVSHLLGKWAALNLGRSVLPLLGAVVGAVTFLQNVL